MLCCLQTENLLKIFNLIEHNDLGYIPKGYRTSTHRCSHACSSPSSTFCTNHIEVSCRCLLSFFNLAINPDPLSNSVQVRCMVQERTATSVEIIYKKLQTEDVTLGHPESKDKESPVTGLI